jgi:hypothetical protein
MNTSVLTKLSVELFSQDTENLWQVPSQVDDVAEVRGVTEKGVTIGWAAWKNAPHFLDKAFRNNTIWIKSSSEPFLA